MGLIKLKDWVLKLFLWLLDKDVCTLTFWGINIEKELVVNNLLDRISIVFKCKHLVYELNTECLTTKVIIDSNLTFTHYIWCCAVLTFPKLKLKVFKFFVIRSSHDFIVSICQAIVSVQSSKFYLSLMIEVKPFRSTCIKGQVFFMFIFSSIIF